MELINRTKDEVTQQVFTFQLEDGTVVHYKEWLNAKGKVIDSSIVSKDGYPLDLELENELIEQIQEKVDEICANDI